MPRAVNVPNKQTAFRGAGEHLRLHIFISGAVVICP